MLRRRKTGPTQDKVTWVSLFKHRTLWGMMLGFFCLNFVIYFFITWFPSYLVQTRGFSLKSLGTLGMIPALVSIPGGWLGGFVSDCAVSARLEPHRGAQDLHGRRHAALVDHHALCIHD